MPGEAGIEAAQPHRIAAVFPDDAQQRLPKIHTIARVQPNPKPGDARRLHRQQPAGDSGQPAQDHLTHRFPKFVAAGLAEDLPGPGSDQQKGSLLALHPVDSRGIGREPVLDAGDHLSSKPVFEEHFFPVDTNQYPMVFNGRDRVKGLSRLQAVLPEPGQHARSLQAQAGQAAQVGQGEVSLEPVFLLRAGESEDRGHAPHLGPDGMHRFHQVMDRTSPLEAWDRRIHEASPHFSPGRWWHGEKQSIFSTLIGVI